MEFQPLQVAQRPSVKGKEKEEKEGSFWRGYKSTVFLKSYAPLTHISFSPSSPHRYLVTSGTRLQLYSPKTNRVVKTISRFKETARSGHLRKDGKLAVAGDDGGNVQVFDLSSRAVLRSWKASSQAIHTTTFSPSGSSILTSSSDTLLRLFDLSTSASVRTFRGHTDYVRAASFLPGGSDLIFSGGYDGTVRLWDPRAQERGGQVWLATHGRPVEAVLVAPEGTRAVSAGGPFLRVWDILGASSSSTAASADEDGSQSYVLATPAAHQKTITSLSFAPGPSSSTSGGRLLSGGLDGLVKVYDPLSNYAVRHTIRYGGQVLSLAVSPNGSHLLTGLADGSLSIRVRPTPRAGPAREENSAAQKSYEALLAAAQQAAYTTSGAEAAPLAAHAGGVISADKTGEKEVRLKRERKRKLKEWDRCLKAFRYGDALDSVLQPDVSPSVTFALLQELVHRPGALRTALSNRTDSSLAPLLSLLLKHLTTPRFAPLVARVLREVLDLYAGVVGKAEGFDAMLKRIRKRVEAELEFGRELEKTRGMMEALMGASQQQRVR